MKKEIGRETIVKSLILLGFSILLFSLAASGRIRLYINPRFTILSELASAALFLMFIVQVFHTHAAHAHEHCCHDAPQKWVYAVFILPLALAMVFPGAVLDASMAANRGLNLNSGKPAVAGPAPVAPGAVQASANAAGPEGSADDQSDGINESGLIRVTEANFVRVATSLNQSPGRYEGRQIDMLGLVMRNKDFAPEEFGLIRFVITCCSADASPGGFICKSKDADNYKDGAWLSIRGTIRTGTYNQQVFPVIEIASVKRAVQPPDPYVYP